jgi:hypothetical protein
MRLKYINFEDEVVGRFSVKQTNLMFCIMA